MKKYLFLSSAFLFLFTFTKAQPNLIGITSQGAVQFGSIFNYTVGDSTLSNVYELEGNPGMGLDNNGMIEIGGKLYGCLAYGGANSTGIIYEYDPVTNNYTSIYDFISPTGSTPYCDLLLASNGKCYGTTSSGGTNNRGVIFEFDIASKTYTKKFDMVQSIGYDCKSTLIQATNGKLYGLTSSGGSSDGAIFEFDYNSNIFTIKFYFDGLQGSIPKDRLLQASNGKLYGTTRGGGISGAGVIFEYDLITGTYSKKFDFISSIGSQPQAGLIQATNGNLYGTTQYGGINGDGTIFEYNYTSNICTTKFSFDEYTNQGGYAPLSRLLQATNGKLYGTTSRGNSSTSYTGSFFEFDPLTNTYINLVFLNSLNVSHFLPLGSPVMQASNGKIYGVLNEGGISNGGVIFEYNLNTNIVQKKIDLYFVSEGGNPYGSLVLASNGKFYGVNSGGLLNRGVLFEYNSNTNSYTKKIDFSNTTGMFPSGSLMQASNGKLYGTTQMGGLHQNGILYEYEITTNTFTKKVDFSTLDFYACGSLLEASNGKFYGLARGDNSNYANYGFLYEYNPTTNYITFIFSFTNSTGFMPNGSLIEASNGNLYGMTSEGGDFQEGTIFQFNYNTHTLYKLYSFQSNIDGGYPLGSLIEATNGKLYGMTCTGGTFSRGTIFEYDYTSYIFTKKIDLTLSEGSNPTGSLMEASNGKLYGMTNAGGLFNDGVLFEYDYVANTYIKQIDFNSPLTGSKPFNSALLEVNCVAPAITSSGPISFCQGGSVTLNATTTPGGTYQWSRNGNIIAGATNQSLLVTNPGKYSVTVSDSNCNNSLTSGTTRVTIPCIDPFDPQEKIALGENNSDDPGITIFFDSNLNVLSVTAQNIRGKSFIISIYDNAGKLVLTENGVVVNSEIATRINCSSFSKGLFISKLTTEQEQHVKKFVIN